MKENEVSKLVSYWLRHNPLDANLRADEFGWINCVDLIAALQFRGEKLNITDLYKLSLTFDKIRWEFNHTKSKIRATHGHSFPVIIDEKATSPPDTLYHGTTIENLANIINNGLQPMKRQFVHLSATIEVALEVAKRHGIPILISIDAKSLNENGFVFYKTSDNVWLTNEITPVYLSIEPWQTINYEEKRELLNELSKEVSNGHILNNKVTDLELVMRRYDRDDCLFIDNEEKKVYEVHLTWSNFKEKNAFFPVTKIYKSFTDWINVSLVNDNKEWHNL